MTDHTAQRRSTIVSRRDVLRRAAGVGCAGFPPVRSAALAQTGPATGTPSTTGPAGGYTLRLAGLTPVVIAQDVSARKGNRAAWPVLTGVSIAELEIPRGTWRAPHSHTNTAERAVIVQGRARVGLQAPQQEWMEVDLEAGDCVSFPLGWPHWLRNTGEGALHTSFNYGHEQPATVEVPS